MQRVQPLVKLRPCQAGGRVPQPRVAPYKADQQADRKLTSTAAGTQGHPETHTGVWHTPFSSHARPLPRQPPAQRQALPWGDCLAKGPTTQHESIQYFLRGRAGNRLGIQAIGLLQPEASGEQASHKAAATDLRTQRTPIHLPSNMCAKPSDPRVFPKPTTHPDRTDGSITIRQLCLTPATG